MQPENNIGRVQPKVKSDLKELSAGKGKLGMGLTEILSLVNLVLVSATVILTIKNDRKKH